jgi:hypothetical protein
VFSFAELIVASVGKRRLRIKVQIDSDLRRGLLIHLVRSELNCKQASNQHTGRYKQALIEKLFFLQTHCGID